MKKLLLLSAVLVGAASASYAGVSFNINLGAPAWGAPPPAVIISHPAPVVYQPAQPVCETPAPQVYQPQPVCEPQVVVTPPPVVYQPAPRVVVVPERRGEYYHSREYAFHRDWDRGHDYRGGYDRDHRH
jgi:hypothetical protein